MGGVDWLEVVITQYNQAILVPRRFTWRIIRGAIFLEHLFGDAGSRHYYDSLAAVFKDCLPYAPYPVG